MATSAGALSAHHEGPSQYAMEEESRNRMQATFSTHLPMKHETGELGIRWRCRVKEFWGEDGRKRFERSQRLEMQNWRKILRETGGIG